MANREQVSNAAKIDSQDEKLFVPSGLTVIFKHLVGWHGKGFLFNLNVCKKIPV